MECSIYFSDVYEKHNYLLNFGQKLHLFLDVYFRMDIIKGTVREDVLNTYFRSTQSRVTNRKADTSTERACQSKW